MTKKLDLLVRLSHPDWFPLLSEWAQMANENYGDIRLRQIEEKIWASGFGALRSELLHDFKFNGFRNVEKWWKWNMVKIAGSSDSPVVIEAVQERWRQICERKLK